MFQNNTIVVWLISAEVAIGAGSGLVVKAIDVNYTFSKSADYVSK